MARDGSILSQGVKMKNKKLTSMIKLEEMLDSEEALKEHLSNLKDNVFGSRIDAAIDEVHDSTKKEHQTLIKLCNAIKKTVDEIEARDSSFTLECGGNKMVALRAEDWSTIIEIIGLTRL